MADPNCQPAERFSSQALDDAEKGSAVVTVVTKRIRAASKRMKKIEATEAKSQGQPEKLNQDQKELLDSKPKTLANIEELERLIPLLQEAEGEEKNNAVKRAVERALAEERANVAAQAPMTPAVPADIDDEARRAIESETVDRMLHLLYFSQTFDFDKPGELTMLERHACESYFNQQQPDKMPLCQYDFKNFCKLGSLMVSRPTDECISHGEALQQAYDLAMQWLHPTDAPVDALSNLSMKEISFSLQRMMDSDYKSVRPVLAPPSSEPAVHPHGSLQDAPNSRPLHADHLQQHQSRYVHCIKQEQALQGRPITPELHQQDSHTYSDVTPPADPSPTESPIPQHSGQTHYAPSQHHGQPYGQADSDHEYYQQPQDGYAALGEAMPNGQDYHTAFAPPLNFMSSNGADTGALDSAPSQETAGQHPSQGDQPNSAYTNGHTASDSSQGQSEGRTVPLHAPLQDPQASYGTRQRGDGSRGPDRQGSFNRGYGGGRYEGGPPRGRGGGYRGRRDSTGRGDFSRGGGRRGRGDGYRGRGGFGSGSGELGRGSRGGMQRRQQGES